MLYILLTLILTALSTFIYFKIKQIKVKQFQARVDKALKKCSASCASKKNWAPVKYSEYPKESYIDYGEAYDFHHDCGDR